MSVLFNTYETTFREAIQKINADGGSFSSALAEASDALRSMELAMRDAAPEDVDSLRSRFRSYKSMLESVKKSVLVADKSASSQMADERARSQARLNSIASIHTLQKSQRIVAETEAVAANVVDTLGDQRAQLERTRHTLGVVKSQLERSDRTVRKMSSWWGWCADICVR